MRVLVGCERSGIIREAFRARGHDAWSCDLAPSEDSSPFHYVADVRSVLVNWWDLFIVHPECRYLSSSGLHWNTRRPERIAETDRALEFVREVFFCHIPRIALENPQGCINTRIPEMPKPQYIQPYHFGEDASKKTGLWLKGLPRLVPTKFVQPRIVNGKPRWANQTNSGQNRLGPSETRPIERARTYLGIANAMAEQWGSLETGYISNHWRQERLIA